MRPVYFVVAKAESIYPLGWQVNHILRVFSCDLSEVNELYQRYAVPLYDDPSAGPIQTYIFEREPDNPFQALAAPGEGEAHS